jgi:hypothetical protein
MRMEAGETRGADISLNSANICGSIRDFCDHCCCLVCSSSFVVLKLEIGTVRDPLTGENIASISYLSILQFAVVVLLAILLGVAEVLDWIGRCEIIEKRWPKLWKAINNRPMRLIAYIVLIIFLIKDIQLQTDKPIAPPLVVTFAPPPQPIVNEERPSSPKPAGNTTVVHGSVTQTTGAPCTANNLSGNVNLAGCNPPKNPYVPVFTYDPDGTKHGAYGTRFTSDDSLRVVFQKFLQLQQENNWAEILSLSEATKKTDPGWFLLDYISGVAQLNLCQASEATRDLKKFYSETTDIPSYAALHDDVAKKLNFLGTYAYQQRCAGQTQ